MWGSPGIRIRPEPKKQPLKCAGWDGRVPSGSWTPMTSAAPRLSSTPWQRTLHTNLNGAFVCLQSAARRMVAMALELAEFGITANSVAPGEIATPMTGQTDQDPTTTDRPGVPLGRPGDAREIAAVIAFLASPASSYVTGASWAVDGGMLQMRPQAGSPITEQGWREG